MAYIRGKGIVLREPCVAAIERGTGKLVAIGQEAKALVGRAPDNLMIVRPMQDGVIANFDATERMLTLFFNRIVGSRIFFKPRAVVAVPSMATYFQFPLGYHYNLSLHFGPSTSVHGISHSG